MKKLLLLTASILGFSGVIKAQGDIPLDEEAMYFDIDDMPNAVIWLPAVSTNPPFFLRVKNVSG